MIILLVILALACCWQIRFSDYHEDYISAGTTNAVKGIFALLILFSHVRGYINLDNSFANKAYTDILNHTGQLMVAPFLFYSGYGILESIKRKKDYFVSYPKKRILKTLLNFDMAVVFYLILMSILGVYYAPVNYITCWIGWESIGNSNWFIFDILLLYCIVYAAHLATKKCKYASNTPGAITLLTLGLSILMWAALKLSGKGQWWFDTILTFPAGMAYSYYKQPIESILKNRSTGIAATAAVTVIFLFWHFLIGNDEFGLCACLFCIVIAALSTKIKTDNPLLQWFGTHAFAIYIIQRLPMNLYQHLGWNENPYIFVLISIPSALLCAYCFRHLTLKA